MLFSSLVFLFVFLPTVIFFYYVVFGKSRRWQNILLLFMSLFFYGYGEPSFVFVMMGSIITNWAFALIIDKVRENKTKTRIAMTLMLIANFGIMFIFKYLMFTLKNVNYLFGTSIAVPTIILPIGISFFTFQAVSYVFDVYRRNGEVQKNPMNVGLYISFFPQLIAGPIVRYETIAEQIHTRKETWNDFSTGVCRFIIGLGKKIIIANSFAYIADKAFGVEPSSLSVGFAWLGVVAYAFQIFFDFSGYSDMAIGLGKMFGFHFLENFDFPYISKSITEFWRRWHISLGTWFRDYVYFPLGGSRVNSKIRLVLNLFIVWMLTGIWHGANWTFFVWGFMYFVLIAFEKLTGLDKKLKWFGHIYAMFFVLLGWVVFRSDNLVKALEYIKSMIGLGAGGLIDTNAVFYFSENKYFYLIALIASIPVSKWLQSRLTKKSAVFDVLYIIFILFIFIISVSYMVKGSYSPFIYFNF